MYKRNNLLKITCADHEIFNTNFILAFSGNVSASVIIKAVIISVIIISCKATSCDVPTHFPKISQVVSN